MISSDLEKRMTTPHPLRIQLWSWNYAPEPTAMGPVATCVAGELHKRGHEVRVVTAHAHYPPDRWRQRILPYRETRDEIQVLRLPLWIGHGSALQRIREEVTFALSAALAAGAVARPDVIVSVSPSFLALAPMIANTRLRRVPWVLWLQDILPDAAAATGLLRNPIALHPAHRLERAAYQAADRIAVISETFAANLRAKGVPASKLAVVYNPATRGFVKGRETKHTAGGARVFHMGNIGLSQGLVEVVNAFEESPDLPIGTRLIVAGHGERAREVSEAVVSERIEVLGLVSDARLDQELDRATLGLVSQRPDLAEFNVPSKLMTLMARAIPILAHVRSNSEVAWIVRSSGAGWISDASTPEQLGAVVARALADPAELRRRGSAGLAFAREHFAPAVVAERLERETLAAVSRAARQ